MYFHPGSLMSHRFLVDNSPWRGHGARWASLDWSGTLEAGSVRRWCGRVCCPSSWPGRVAAPGTVSRRLFQGAVAFIYSDRHNRGNRSSSSATATRARASVPVQQSLRLSSSSPLRGPRSPPQLPGPQGSRVIVCEVR